jgi:hypothetical protein
VLGTRGLVEPIATAYTKSGSFGSAVIEFLSLKKFGSVSTRSTIGACQVRPPVLERL